MYLYYNVKCRKVLIRRRVVFEFDFFECKALSVLEIIKVEFVWIGYIRVVWEIIRNEDFGFYFEIY